MAASLSESASETRTVRTLISPDTGKAVNEPSSSTFLTTQPTGSVEMSNEANVAFSLVPATVFLSEIGAVVTRE